MRHPTHPKSHLPMNIPKNLRLTLDPRNTQSSHRRIRKVGRRKLRTSHCLSEISSEWRIRAPPYIHTNPTRYTDTEVPLRHEGEALDGVAIEGEGEVGAGAASVAAAVACREAGVEASRIWACV